MNEFSELEFKYKADSIELQDFLKVMGDLPIVKQKDVSSWDHYYTNGTEDEFIRYRESTDPELTIKRKVNQANNWQRVEVDLPLDLKRAKTTTISKFVDLLGYSNKKSIYKTCFIYWMDYINFVYYIVYDVNMKEKGRFIEVEINKERLGNEFVDVSGNLKRGQEILAKLGLMPQNRLKKSLYELFIK
jgi:adenylate cyclase class IV